jgi:energy-coupling factor transporter ATP-binding protein EcfA2
MPSDPPDSGDVSFTDFDELVESLRRWSGSAQQWPPARQVRGEWERIEPRLDRARRELSRVLVVGVVGGTGTGKSTLVNALAGGDVSPAGDVARPTTTNPVVVVATDVDCSWLPIDAMSARVVRSAAAAVANIVLIDCPDPDTQSEGPTHAPDVAAPSRPSDTNRNRDLLEAVLPACDVLLLVATAQKYRSWVVAREVAAFAPGRPLLFVQTHASRDPDIRDDWRRELEAQGFVVPRIYRLDALEAARRAAAGLEPETGFQELVRAIDEELVGRAARRVRRTGAIDLASWFTRQSQSQCAAIRGPVEALAAGVVRERGRLEGILAKAVESRLRTNRSAWQRVLTDEIVERWHGGPFAMFLHTVAAIASFWPRVRSAGGGLIGRLLAGQPPPAAATGHGAWQAIEELGLGEADVEQSRSILVGLAARARMAEPMVGRARLEAARVQETVGALLERTGSWLAAGIERLVADRRGRIDGPVFRWVFESLFSLLLVAVLSRAAWNFFHGHLWSGRPLDGAGFLQESLLWVILWGFFLRWVVFAWVRMGLDRDIAALVSRLPAARLVDPLLADFAEAADTAGGFLDRGDGLARDCAALAARLSEPTAGLGRLRGESLS